MKTQTSSETVTLGTQMYESPWSSIQWRCFQTCFNIPSPLIGTHSQGTKRCSGHQPPHWPRCKSRERRSRDNTRVFEKKYMKPPPTIERENGTSIQAAFLIWAFISTNNGVCILTSKDGPLSQAISRISKVPNCKGCCWKTWFPGTRCYTNLGYHGFWWRKEMDKMESLAEQMRGKTHTLTVNVIFLKLTLRVDGGLIKRLPACQNGNDAWWFCSKPTNCTPQENNPTDRHWTTPNKSTSHLPKMFSAIVLYEHLRACFHFLVHFICISSLTFNFAWHGWTWCPTQVSFHHSRSSPETPRNYWGHGLSARLKWSHSPQVRTRESARWFLTTCQIQNTHRIQ